MLKIYVCGPTVYNDLHIGNMVPILTFDLTLKARRVLGEKFTFVHNITDIDDKIINRARELNISEKELSQKYTKDYLKLLKTLDVDTISHLEKVTDNMDLIIEYVNKQVKNNNAYIDQEGNVWFDVKKFENHYGQVANLNLDKMIFEEQNNNKKFEADFALWKKTNVGIQFDSPFSKGRPGWHTECAVLINKHFKNKGLDIHGGGMDLTFPHHENENIQHFALYNQDITKEWIRCGQINYDGEKMSKSLGNVILAKDFLKEHDHEILKLIILSSKISAPINVTNELIENMYVILNKYKKLIFKFFIDFKNIDKSKVNKNEEFIKIMNSLKIGDFSDFNYLLNEQIKEFNKTKNIKNAEIIFNTLKVIHPQLTIKANYNKAFELFDQWRCFIDKKEYKQADKIREKLMKLGVY